METIVDIRKMPGCALLCLENGETLRVPLPLLREKPVRRGERVDPEAYRQYLLQRGFPHALDCAVRLLSVCDRTEREITLRLQRAGYPDACVRRVIEKLYAAELLDDEAFARRWAESRAHRFGRDRLRQELTRRGVSRQTADEAADKLSDEEQLADAVRLTGKYLARTHGDMDRKLYQRTLAMLARHGYGADIARRALEAVARGEDTEEWTWEETRDALSWRPGK